LSASCGKSAPPPEPADTSDTANLSEPANPSEPADLTNPPDAANPASPSFSERLSALEPYETRSEIIDYYFPEEGGLSEFVPADYGRLYPFRAAASSGGGYYDAFYGLMTADGKIVVDGVYGDVAFYDADDGYYILRTTSSPDGLPDSFETETTVIAADGKYMTGPHPGWAVEPAGDYLVRVIDNSFIRFIDIRSGDVVSSGEYESFYVGGVGIYYRSLDGGDDISRLPEGAEVELLPDGRLGVYIKYNPETYPQIQLGTWHQGCNVVCELSENIFVRAAYEDVVAITDKSGELYWRSGASVYIDGHFLKVDDEVFDLEMNELPGFDTFTRITDSLYAFRLKDSDGGSFEVRDIKTGKNIRVYSETWFGHAIMITPERFFSDGLIYDMDGNSERVFPENATYYKADGDLLLVSTNVTGLYTATGEEILPIKYKALSSLGDGLYSVSIDNYMGVINEKGEWLVKIDMLKFRD
jgi:hypothetical protein